MDVIGRWTKGLLHLLVGGACAALVVWLAYGFTQTVTHTDGPARAATLGLVALAILVGGVLLLAPPVRPAEAALARALLDVSLPEPAETSSWDSRLRGLGWALAVILLGGLSLFALLWCLPQGVWLVVTGFSEGARAELPGVLAELPGAVLVLLGLAIAAVGVLVQPLLVVLLRRLAPHLLGPTPGDRLLHAEREHRRLLEANDLARELHDSVGHALTAIGVQAEAGARVADRDPAFARDALRQIAETTNRAVAELDGVLGTLRKGLTGTTAGTTGAGGAALDDVVELLGPLGPCGSGVITMEQAERVDGTAARTTYRVVQEALTNARRHGTGEPRGQVRVVGGRVEVLLENDLAPGLDDAGHSSGDGARGGRGLVGMRERLTLAGGTLDAGPVVNGGRQVWRLEATLPAATREDDR